MAYNLIDERWIPVERRSGKVELIAPAEVADREDPPLRIASPRPDFDGALLEFLIGLLQTAAAPATERAWRKEWEEPPAVKLLAKRLATVREAFFLDGEGPRFMQDLTVAKDPDAKELPVGALLIDRIGEKELGESPTLFAKPGLFQALGYPAAAAALMAMQTYAPAGGRGQLTSLRRGGPITTLVRGATLWETAWLNVLPRNVFEQVVPGDATKEAPGAIFPWMVRTRTSETKGGKATPPKAVHPLQHLWGLPRRFRLVIGDGHGTCAVTGASGRVVTALLSRPDGTSYDGDYRHPWTAYSEIKAGQPWNPKKGSADGLPYRDWPLFVTGTEQRTPAAVVAHFARSRSDLVVVPRLLAFGYAMDNMKPVRWCRSETPIVSVAPEQASSFAAAADALVAVSEEIRRTFSAQVRAAWSDRPADLEVFDRVNPAFWSRTEPGFFAALVAIKGALEGGDGKACDQAAEAWLTGLHQAALELFQTFVEPSADLAAPDLRRALHAERALTLFTHPSSTKLRKLLNLPVEEKPSPAGKKPGRGAKKETRR